MLQTLVSPLQTLSATMAVTSLPVWVTPWATTPLSAQNMTTARLAMSGVRVPWMAHRSMTASSKSPRLPRGFATAFHFSWAFWRMAASMGWMAARASFKVM